MDAYLDQLPQQMVQGLTLGGIYALIALGLTMVYGVLFMLNFAHGEIYMIGGFAGWWSLSLLTANHGPLINGVVLVFFLVVIAMTVTACLGMTIERFAYRPLRTSPRMNLLLSALGASLFLQSAVLAFQGPEPRFFSSYVLIPESIRIFYIGDVVISFMRVIVIVVAFVLMAVLTLIIRKTRVGKAMRATAQDREAASLTGIDTDKIILLVFLIGSALGGAAGTLAGLLLARMDYYAGVQAGLKGFTAAVLGGMGSVSGAMIGGIVLGLLEASSTLFFPPAYKDAVAFAVLVLVLVLRPRGLMGKKVLEKV